MSLLPRELRPLLRTFDTPFFGSSLSPWASSRSPGSLFDPTTSLYNNAESFSFPPVRIEEVGNKYNSK
jgi:hypothetical protein